MQKYENNAYFWQKIDTLFSSSSLEMRKKKGDTHPKYKKMIYPVDYGYLKELNDEKGVSVYRGTDKPVVNAIIVAADILERDLDVKLLVGCTEEEEENVLRFLNQTDFQKTILIRRGNEVPSWGITD